MPTLLLRFLEFFKSNAYKHKLVCPLAYYFEILVLLACPHKIFKKALVQNNPPLGREWFVILLVLANVLHHPYKHVVAFDQKISIYNYPTIFNS